MTSPQLNAAKLNDGWDRAYQERAGDTLWQDDPIPFLNTALEEMNKRGLTSVADLGCGDGRNLAALAAAGLDATGLDVSATALERAQRRLEASGLTARYLHADAMRIPLDDASVDAVTCLDVFSHLVEPEAALSEVARVLRPGGIFVTNVFNTADSECGLGELLFGTTYYYRDTMFRFYQEDELRALFSEWDVLEFRTEDWVDPPHGEFRPYEHTHSNFLVTATLRNANASTP